jgi:hypothetical protein
MEIVRSHRQLAAAAAAGSSGAGVLPTYRVAPQLEVRLEEFEIFAIDRLRGASPCSLYCRIYSPRCLLRYCPDLADELERDAILLRCVGQFSRGSRMGSRGGSDPRRWRSW